MRKTVFQEMREKTLFSVQKVVLPKVLGSVLQAWLHVLMVLFLFKFGLNINWEKVNTEMLFSDQKGA